MLNKRERAQLESARRLCDRIRYYDEELDSDWGVAAANAAGNISEILAAKEDRP
ncbi:MAG: hypothetical protein HRU00_17475 [Myxococcales bacterium]|nr:hypothetical protein [Myxococcales bacterium]